MTRKRQSRARMGLQGLLGVAGVKTIVQDQPLAKMAARQSKGIQLGQWRTHHM